MILMAVDPGLRITSASVWDSGELGIGGELIWAGYAVNPVRTERGPKAWDAMAAAVLELYPLGLDTLLLELQQHYPGRGISSDLTELTGVCGAIVGQFHGRCHEFVGVLPRVWSNVPKDVRHARLEDEMTEEEWSKVELPPQASLAHNVKDAIALGLWYLTSRSLRLRAESAKVSAGSGGGQ